MRIAVSLVVDLDPAKRAEIYGVENVRDDVRQYLLNSVRVSRALRSPEPRSA
jgi:hypothetical protein